jgi:hypothetical protein
VNGRLLISKSVRDVNNDSGLGQFAFHIPPESVFTISRNAYSHAPDSTAESAAATIPDAPRR